MILFFRESHSDVIPNARIPFPLHSRYPACGGIYFSTAAVTTWLTEQVDVA
jgi:hypothetical protein